ncbi:STAS domain-containing protein [Actinomadura sp. HBU206391]|uniref:STAS domain-containing protein n=1 Tax=Actinomadura sp. HBU206391 TaxID=2731692 RepID=UPI00164FC4E1|nr:STAS domain-containing protein [Actinomadura sp. HBU206391]MBC6459899.1 STAS domain-containing protein [Actinomadura sp. HBU206391]
MNPIPARDTRTGPSGSKFAGRMDHKVVALRGEIDIATTPALRERLNDALGSRARSPRRLIIDLSGVTFCDASGLALLIGTQRRARLLGTRVSLVAPRSQVVKLLQITGLRRSLTVHATLTTAINEQPSTTTKSAQGVRRVPSARAQPPSAG